MTKRKKGISDFRNVSDLREQYYCEYRFYLKQVHGDTSSDASRQGERLHSQISTSETSGSQMNPILFLLIIIIIISGIMWIWR